MISRIPHPMAPGHFALLEDELPAYLRKVPALQDITAGSDFLEDGFDRIHQHRGLYIFRALGSKAQGSRHSQQIIDVLGRIGVDWKWTCCLLDVEGNEIGLPTPDNEDLR